MHCFSYVLRYLISLELRVLRASGDHMRRSQMRIRHISGKSSRRVAKKSNSETVRVFRVFVFLCVTC